MHEIYYDKTISNLAGCCLKILKNGDMIGKEYEKLLEAIRNKKEVFFIIKRDKEIIGRVNASLDLINKKAEMGIILRKRYINKGYGIKALIMFLFYLFYFWNLRKVKLEVYSDNKRAVNVYKKVGFKEVGIFKEEYFCFGRYRDVLAMELFKEEFFGKNKIVIEEIKKENKLA